MLLKYGLQLAAASLLGTLMFVSSAAEQGTGEKHTQAVRPTAVRPAITYKPPLREAPGDLDAAGTRTAGGKIPILEVFAPDHVGLTTKAQPRLYWYLNTPVAAGVEFTLLQKRDQAPLLKTRVGSREVAAGIHQLDLADHDISLQPGVGYRWSVAVANGEDGRSGSLVASGMIERMEPGEGLRSRIRKVRGIARVEVYASEGLWYDALESISSMIEESPGDQSLAAVRTSLLEQAGLHASAGH